MQAAGGVEYLYNFGMFEVLRPASANLDIKDGMSNTGSGDSFRLAGIVSTWYRAAVACWFTGSATGAPK